MEQDKSEGYVIAGSHTEMEIRLSYFKTKTTYGIKESYTGHPGNTKKKRERPQRR